MTDQKQDDKANGSVVRDQPVAISGHPEMGPMSSSEVLQSQEPEIDKEVAGYISQVSDEPSIPKGIEVHRSIPSRPTELSEKAIISTAQAREDSQGPLDSTKTWLGALKLRQALMDLIRGKKLTNQPA